MKTVNWLNLSSEDFSKLPAWITTSKKDRTPFQKYANYIYNKILQFTQTEKLEAIANYHKMQNLKPNWEKSFKTLFFTDEMIKNGYNKSPEDKVEKINLTYRELLNAYYYKAYSENLSKLDEFENQQLRRVLKKVGNRLYS